VYFKSGGAIKLSFLYYFIPKTRKTNTTNSCIYAKGKGKRGFV